MMLGDIWGYLAGAAWHQPPVFVAVQATGLRLQSTPGIGQSMLLDIYIYMYIYIYVCMYVVGQGNIELISIQVHPIGK